MGWDEKIGLGYSTDSVLNKVQTKRVFMIRGRLRSHMLVFSCPP